VDSPLPAYYETETWLEADVVPMEEPVLGGKLAMDSFLEPHAEAIILVAQNYMQDPSYSM
jgi:hypothetical protein